MKADFRWMWANQVCRTYFLVNLLMEVAVGFTLSTYVLWVLQNGVDLMGVNLLNTLYMSVSFCLDPITGVLADRFGQRRVYVMGQVFWSVGMLIYGFGRTFGVFAIAESTAAVGSALMSEALEAWTRNELSEADAKRLFALEGGYIRVMAIPFKVAGGIVGAVMGLQWPWLIGGALGLVTSVVSAGLLARHKEQVVRHESNAPSLKEGIREFMALPEMRTAGIVVFVVGVCTTSFNMFWQPVFRDLTGQAWWLGFTWIGISTLYAAGSLLSKRVSASKLSLGLSVVAIGIPMLLPLLFHEIPVLVVATFLLHEVGRGAAGPLIYIFGNKNVDPRHRSTVNSVRSALGTAGMAVGLVLSGLMTYSFSPIQIWFVAAAILVLFGVAVSFRK